jgi:hypothetical protein
MRMESPPEEATLCAELAFMMSRGRLSIDEKQSAFTRMETCSLCRVAYNPPAGSALRSQVAPA